VSFNMFIKNSHEDYSYSTYIISMLGKNSTTIELILIFNFNITNA